MEVGPDGMNRRLITGLAFLAGGLLGAAAVVVAPDFDTEAEAPPETPVVAMPGQAHLDAYTCPSGTLKTIQIGGREDGLDPRDAEPSRMADSFRTFRVHAASFAQRGQTGGSRDYDERGTDKRLYDYFEVGPGLVSGDFVVAFEPGPLPPTGGAAIYVTEVVPKLDNPLLRNAATGIVLGEAFEPVPGAEGVKRIAIGDILSPVAAQITGVEGDDLLSTVDAHLPRGERGRPAFTAQVVVGPDFAVDFMALVTCHRPEARGMSWTSSDIFREATGLNTMGCGFDLALEACDARVGDLACSEALPLACFADGDRRPPEVALPAARARVDANFTGGEIRLTEPVVGETLETLEDANALCADRFGEGWRVLDHHVAGGKLALSHSDIPHGARAWVDIRTAPNATCWSRP